MARYSPEMSKSRHDILVGHFGYALSLFLLHKSHRQTTPSLPPVANVLKLDRKVSRINMHS